MDSNANSADVHSLTDKTHHIINFETTANAHDPKTDDEKIYKDGDTVPESIQKQLFKTRSPKNIAIDLIIWVPFTAFIIAMLLGAKGKQGKEISCLIYIFVSLRILAKYVCISRLVYEPLGKTADSISLRTMFIKPYLTVITFAVTALLIVATALTTPLGSNASIASRMQSILGIVIMLLLMYVCSRNRSKIPWHTVASGLMIQYFIAIFVLKTQIGQDIFSYLSQFIAFFLGFSNAGAFFIFGVYTPTVFAQTVLPAIIFFCSFISIVYHFGGMQYLVVKLAWLFVRLMDTSGAESCVACASPFIGQGESALLVAPFVEFMTRSELHSTMVSGFATIAGSVMIIFLMLVNDPKMILCACVMSIPASLLLSKMRYPEEEESLTKGDIRIPEKADKETNFLHAATNGSAIGMQLVILIIGSLLAIVSLFYCANYLVGWAFDILSIVDKINPPLNQSLVQTIGAEPIYNKVSIQLILSFFFAPAAWLIGIQADQCRLAGEIMARKMVVNEFDAYVTLNTYIIDPITKQITSARLSGRSADLLAFALCGFANIASMGLQIGALGAIAPSRTKDLAELVFSAMLTGTISTWLTACVAGAIM